MKIALKCCCTAGDKEQRRKTGGHLSYYCGYRRHSRSVARKKVYTRLRNKGTSLLTRAVLNIIFARVVDSGEELSNVPTRRLSCMRGVVVRSCDNFAQQAGTATKRSIT